MIMKKEKILLTKQGFVDLKKEYEDLVNNQRPEIVAEIKRSRELGDLSENGAYTAARERQSFVEGRIQELEDILKRAEVVEKSVDGTVVPGSLVTLRVNGMKVEYMIVGAGEADSAMKKISHESPLGKALLGKKAGDTVKVSAPVGEVEYKIETVK